VQGATTVSTLNRSPKYDERMDKDDEDVDSIADPEMLRSRRSSDDRYPSYLSESRATPERDVRRSVWGIGLTRTGTRSLNRALEILGYRAVHYPTISTLLHEPLEAATDEPVAVMYKYLDFVYPNSQFILTERGEDEWVRSTAEHRRRHFERRRRSSPLESSAVKPESNWIQGEFAMILRHSLLRDRIVERVFTQTALYETVEFDEGKFRQGYQRHHRDVERYFAKRSADLLRIRICEGEGWDSICDFLGHPVPNEPFPKIRSRRDRMRQQA
jgi:Sulfotransferase domain